MQLIRLVVISGESVSRAGNVPGQLRDRIEEVDQLRDEEPMTDHWNLTWIELSIPKIAAIASTMPA